MGCHSKCRDIQLFRFLRFSSRWKLAFRFNKVYIPRLGSIRAKKGRKQKWKPCSLSMDLKYSCVGESGLEGGSNFPVLASMVANPINAH